MRELSLSNQFSSKELISSRNEKERSQVVGKFGLSLKYFLILITETNVIIVITTALV